MAMQELLEQQARHVAERLGHDVGPLHAGRYGEHVAACTWCGALIIVVNRPGAVGIRGTACSTDCRSRQRLRLIPPAVEADSPNRP